MPITDPPSPVSPENLFTTREQVILLRGSKIHGCIFPPWKETDSGGVMVDADWEDGTEFYLSPEQREVFAGWQRPPRPNPGTVPNFEGHDGDSSKGSVDLVQDITSDCSVVASLCAETARAERLGFGKDSLVRATMHPRPGRFSARRYVLKLNFNGCFRKVEIDDRLPTSTTKERTLHVFDREDPENVYWPALVEKAYLKVRGGYDFPGSNSGTDLWILIGWVPEQLFLQSDDIMPNQFWKRLFQAFNFGDVLVTMGTPRMGRREERESGLASEHAYAVVDMRELDGRREFLIKNPWSEGGVWRGPTADANAQEPGNGGEILRPGTFWMDLNYVFSNFETIYLNWNPGLFTHRRDVHFTWDLASRSSPGSFTSNPQYTIRCERETSVWIVLSKHFQSFERPDDETDALSRDPRLQIGHLSLYLFESSDRVMLTDGSLRRAPYVDAPNILLRFEAQAKTPYTIVVSEQGLPEKKFEFSLCAFTRSPVLVQEAKRSLGHCAVQHGAWTYATAGGNASSPEYNANPQFCFVIPKSSDIAIIIEAEDPDLAVHVKLIWAGGKRIPPAITKRDILGDSGEYRTGCALTKISQVNAGTYTIVCSTFKQGQLGKFKLKVWSNCGQCVMKSISIHVPGMFNVELPTATLIQGLDRVLAPITVIRLTRLHVRARSFENPAASSGSPMKLSIEYGQGPNTITLASTDRFIDTAGGIRTPDVDVKPTMCGDTAPGVWIVVERMAGSSMYAPENMRVEIFSTEPGVLTGPWGREAAEPIEELQRQMAATSVSSHGSR